MFGRSAILLVCALGAVTTVIPASAADSKPKSKPEPKPFLLNDKNGTIRTSDVDGQTLGTEFTPIADITVTHLGIWDGANDGSGDGTDGLLEAHPIAIYASDSGDALTKAVSVPAGTKGELVGEFRYVKIPDLKLKAGTTYILAVEYTADGPADPLRNADIGFKDVDSYADLAPEADVDPAINLKRGAWEFGRLVLPTHFGPDGVPYVGANFLFTVHDQAR